VRASPARVACVATGMALALAAALAGDAADQQPPDGTWPRTVPRVWYRTGTQRGIAGPKLTGDLVITPESLELLASKRDVSIPFDAVRMISLGKMRGDVDTEWVVLSVQRGDERELVGLRDGRKFGYGGRTTEIYEMLHETAQRFSWAQFSAPEGFRPYPELDRVFAVAVPQGWSTYHHDMESVDGLVRWGTVVFTPRPLLEETATGKERRHALEAIQRGQMTAWVVDRREVEGGMSCEGFHKNALRTLGGWISEDPFFGQPFTVGESPAFEPTRIDGCAGLALALRAEEDGPDTPVLELRIVAREGTLVLMGLRSTVARLDDDRAQFELGVSTLTLAATR